MPGQSRTLSARAFQYLVNGAPGLEEWRETASGPSGGKLRSLPGPLTQVVTQNSSPGVLGGFGKSLKDLFGGHGSSSRAV